jgi:hypothetical protein
MTLGMLRLVLGRLAGPLLLLAALLLAYQGGRYSGAADERSRAQALASKEAALQSQRIEQARAAAVAQNDKAMQALHQQRAAAADYINTLEKRLKNAPLISTGSRCVAANGAGPGLLALLPARQIDAAAQTSASPYEGLSTAPAGSAAGEPPVVLGVQLTLAAVSLWNSALGGADEHAATCRADEPTSPACAADAGVTLEDAWANHIANAASCAADRRRLKTIVDLLCLRPGQEGCARE